MENFYCNFNLEALREYDIEYTSTIRLNTKTNIKVPPPEVTILIINIP